MKTYFYIGAAVAAALGCSTVNAQVLGGNVAGGLGGAMSGGLRDMSVITQGRGNGSFGADLDTDSHMGTLRRTTSDVAGRTRNTTENVRGRAQSTVGTVKGKGEAAANVAASTAGDAVTTARQIEAPQIDATSTAAGSLASGANIAGNEATSTFDAAHQAQLLSAPVSAPEVAAPAVTPAESVSDAKPGLPKLADAGKVGEAATPAPTSEASKSNLLANGSLAGAMDHSHSIGQNVPKNSGEKTAETNSSPMPLMQSEAAANGQASGQANASKRGASASAEGNGSASAAVKRPQ